MFLDIGANIGVFVRSSGTNVVVMNGSRSPGYSPAAIRSTTPDNVASAAGGDGDPARALASASM